jgi:NADH-quinone oxidoreductase subunit A
VTGAIIVIVLKTITKKIREKQKIEKSKKSPFECGFQSPTHNRLPFSRQFFIVIILFLVFDVEIRIIIPYPTEEKNKRRKVTIILFVVVLVIGLLYEWKKGKLEWSE